MDPVRARSFPDRKGNRMVDQNKIYGHFSHVATSYNEIRTTDLAPIVHIENTLAGIKAIKAVDISCGAGRYDLLLFQQLNNLHLTCVDINKNMIKEMSRYLKSNGITDFEAIHSSIEDVSLKANSFDCVFTFNAIHHFDFTLFLNKSLMCIKSGGIVFIYTRSRSQNARNIWGKYFPWFTEKEDRLYELDEMEGWITSEDSTTLDSVEFFKYRRKATLERLLELVDAKHYSTFSLYGKRELEEALNEFESNIRKDFARMDQIEWCDENIMLTLRVQPKTFP
jgi:ubiquinone/menaquinone biosynthesis C-methylase UbiE